MSYTVQPSQPASKPTNPGNRPVPPTIPSPATVVPSRVSAPQGPTAFSAATKPRLEQRKEPQTDKPVLSGDDVGHLLTVLLQEANKLLERKK